VSWLKGDPRVDQLRSDARFKLLLAKLRLDQ